MTDVHYVRLKIIARRHHEPFDSAQDRLRGGIATGHSFGCP